MHDELGWLRTPDEVGRPFRQWDLAEVPPAAGQAKKRRRWTKGWNVLGVRGTYRGTAASEIRSLTLTGRAVPGARATRGRYLLQMRDGAIEWGSYRNVDRFVVTDLSLTATTGRTRIFRFVAMDLDPRSRRVERFAVAELLQDGRTTRKAQLLVRA